MIDYKKLQAEIHNWSIAKGWMDRDAEPRPLASLLMLTLTEVAESVEAHRMGNPACKRSGMEHLTHMDEELADVVIRLVQMADEHGMELDNTIKPDVVVSPVSVLENHWYIVRSAVDFERGLIEFQTLLNAVEHVAAMSGFNLDEAIKLKMAFNWTRPHKHGKAC